MSEKCWLCSGTGRIERQGFGQLVGMKYGATDPCPNCNGKGETGRCAHCGEDELEGGRCKNCGENE